MTRDLFNPSTGIGLFVITVLATLAAGFIALIAKKIFTNKKNDQLTTQATITNDKTHNSGNIQKTTGNNNIQVTGSNNNIISGGRKNDSTD